MARRMRNLLTPVLVGLVAVILGFLAMGQSYAGGGDVAPIDSTVSPWPTAPADTPSATGTAPTSAASPAFPRTDRPHDLLGPRGCANCMVNPLN